MRFFEYESRAVVAKAGIPVTKFGFARTAGEARAIARDINAPVVIKSQVLSGGRMKAGGVQFADTPEEAANHAGHVLGLEIGGHMPRGVLVDSRASVAHEYYAGIVWDGIRKRPVMLFSDMGGIDIEEVAESHPDHVAGARFSTLTPFQDWQAKQLIASLGITGSALNRLTPILARLARLFLQYDMTLAEINPLGELEDGSFVALDAHMDMENEARPRHRTLLHEPGVDKIAVMMSIVSNTRVDIVARGVIKACVELGMDPAEKIAIFRIPGAWEEEGFKILERYGVEYADRSVSLHEAARRAVVKIQGGASPNGAGSHSSG